MPVSTNFSLDVTIGPLEDDLYLTSTDSGVIPVYIYGIDPVLDVLHQIVWTAKKNSSDSDAASTTVQKVLTGLVPTPSGYFTQINSTLWEAFITLSPADIAILQQQHFFDFAVWVTRGGVTYKQTLWVGKTHYEPGITTLTGLIVGSVAVSAAVGPPSFFEVPKGSTLQLTAVVKDTNGNVLPGITPAWSSNDVTRATVSASGLVTGVGLGPVTITASVEGINAAISGTVGATTMAELQTLLGLLGTTSITHYTRAGTGHTLTSGFKAAVTDATGTSAADLASFDDGGMNYDPVNNLFDTGAPNTSSPGTGSLASSQMGFLTGPTVAGSGYTIIEIVKTDHNANSYETSILKSDNTLAMGRQGAPGGQDTRWEGLNLAGSFGSNNASSRGMLPDAGGQMHLFFYDFSGYNTVLQTPTQAERVAMMTGDRDLAAIAHGEGTGFPDTSLRKISGRGWPGFDQPGSWKHRLQAYCNGVLNNAQRDAVAAYSRVEGVADDLGPALHLIGNSFISGNNISTEGHAKQILAAIGTTLPAGTKLTNLGISSAKTVRLIDRINYLDRYIITNKRRSRRVIVFFEWLNSMGDGATQIMADVNTWCQAIRPLLMPGDKIVLCTPNVWSTDAGWLTTWAAVRAAVLANANGYWDAVCDWGNPAWIWGTTAILTDTGVGGRLQAGNLHPTQVGYDDLETGTYGLIPVVAPLLAA